MIEPGRRPVIVDALRTPIGTAGGALAGVEVTELAAGLLATLQARAPQSVGEVCLGNIRGPGGNPARVAALAARLDPATSALTVDRQCGSGLAAVEHTVAMLCGLETGFHLCGGVQSASTQPLTFWPATAGGEPVAFTRPPFTPAAWGDPEMGTAADLVAREHGITRERQDAYAARSHQRAVDARAAGRFDAEILPVAGLSHDERPRSGFTPQRLARFRPVFTPGGTATAANSCGVNDGAAALLVADAGTARRYGLGGLRVVDLVTRGSDPARPGTGLVAAVRALCRRTGVRLDDVDALEFNEAFAGQVLACLDELGIDERRNCVEGGALALGHPWAASGAILLVRLFAQLVRGDAGGLGLAAISIGGGLGTAVLVERC